MRVARESRSWQPASMKCAEFTRKAPFFWQATPLADLVRSHLLVLFDTLCKVCSSLRVDPESLFSRSLRPSRNIS